MSDETEITPEQAAAMAADASAIASSIDSTQVALAELLTLSQEFEQAVEEAEKTQESAETESSETP